MTIKVFDTFDGVAGVDLAAHTPDIDVVGGGWTDALPNVNELDGIGGLKFALPNQDSFIDAGITDQYVIANWNAGGADNRHSISLRRDTAVYASRTAYEFNFRTGDGINPAQIYKLVSGSSTLLASYSASAWSNSTTYSIEPEVVGSLLDFIVDGTSRVSVTDSSIPTGTNAGVVHNLRSSSAARFYDFEVNDGSGFQPHWALVSKRSGMIGAR